MTSLFNTSLGIPPYSIRGAEEALSPIDAASNIRRTINGTLVDLGHDQFQKFKLTVSCSDQEPPAIDGIWPGQIVTVYPISELCFYTATGSASRDIISGTQREANGFTFYRPSLTMMLTNFSTNKDEYGAVISWSMEFEEV